MTIMLIGAPEAVWRDITVDTLGMNNITIPKGNIDLEDTERDGDS